jgi:glycerophosphoryl diester phosphodiesterase
MNNYLVGRKSHMKKIKKKIGIIAGIGAPLIIATPFMTNCSNGSKIKYNAHRGLSSQEFENTKVAFEKAGQSKYVDGIETDVYLTKDYNIVCAHAKNPFRVGIANSQLNNPGPKAEYGQTTQPIPE